MELAYAFIKTGELEDALDALNQQLEQQSQDIEARRLRMRVLLRLGEQDHLQQALADWQALPQPTTADYIDLSVIHERRSDLSAAIEAAQMAHTEAPNNERIAERLLDLLVKDERHTEALALVRQQERVWRWLEREGDILAAMGNDTLATARYGLVLAQLEQFADTMRPDYLKALQARVLLARAHAYRRLEQIETARTLYQAAQHILPDDPAIGFNLGVLAAIEGQHTEALTMCQAALQQGSPQLQDEMRRSLDGDMALMWLAKALA